MRACVRACVRESIHPPAYPFFHPPDSFPSAARTHIQTHARTHSPNHPPTHRVYLYQWFPLSGVIVGLLQLFIIISVGDTLGGSSAYVTIVSQWVVTKSLQDKFPYMANARCGIGNWWQVRGMDYVYGKAFIRYCVM